MCRFDSPFAAILYSASVDHPGHPDIRAFPPSTCGNNAWDSIATTNSFFTARSIRVEIVPRETRKDSYRDGDGGDLSERVTSLLLKGDQLVGVQESDLVCLARGGPEGAAPSDQCTQPSGAHCAALKPGTSLPG